MFYAYSVRGCIEMIRRKKKTFYTTFKNNIRISYTHFSNDPSNYLYVLCNLFRNYLYTIFFFLCVDYKSIYYSRVV